MNKSEITKNLKQIKKLLEEESPIIQRKNWFLINDIEKIELIEVIKEEVIDQVESNYKINILFFSRIRYQFFINIFIYLINGI